MTTSRRVRTNMALYVALVVLACLALVLGVRQQQGDTDLTTRAQYLVGNSDAAAPAGVATDRAGDDLHTSILRAAMAQAMAFINVDHTDVEKSTDRVLAGATGDFAEQYQKGLESLTELTRKYESVMTGKVVSAGVVAGDKDTATVLIAMEGTVSNNQSKGAQANAPRLQLKLVWEGGRWLTNDLIFVP